MLANYFGMPSDTPTRASNTPIRSQGSNPPLPMISTTTLSSSRPPDPPPDPPDYTRPNQTYTLSDKFDEDQTQPAEKILEIIVKSNGFKVESSTDMPVITTLLVKDVEVDVCLSKLERSQPKSMEIPSVDYEGNKFNSTQQMWQEEDETRTQWYSDVVSYREGVGAHVNGELGMVQVNDAGMIENDVCLKTFIEEILVNEETNMHLVTLDCGINIDKINMNLWIQYFNEEFTPAAHMYNVIWKYNQRCIGNLTDKSLEDHEIKEEFKIFMDLLTSLNIFGEKVLQERMQE